MDNFYALFEKEEKLCPTYLEGILHTEFFEKEPFEAKETDFYLGPEGYNKETNLPNEFWFVTKDKKYDFDLRYDAGNCYVSSEFLSLLQKFNTIDFQHQNLHMVNKKKKTISPKNYHFLHFFNRLEDVVDIEKSNIELYRSCDAKGRIKKIWDLQLKETVDFPDVFLIKESKISDRLFCSERFKQAIEQLQMKGILFVPANLADVHKEW